VRMFLGLLSGVAAPGCNRNPLLLHSFLPGCARVSKVGSTVEKPDSGVGGVKPTLVNHKSVLEHVNKRGWSTAWL
jgi:hypothetical protein